jgi:hypothetical protein
MQYGDCFLKKNTQCCVFFYDETGNSVGLVETKKYDF